MWTMLVESLTLLNQTLRVEMYKNMARSRLFCRVAKRSIHCKEKYCFFEIYTPILILLACCQMPASEELQFIESSSRWVAVHTNLSTRSYLEASQSQKETVGKSFLMIVNLILDDLNLCPLQQFILGKALNNGKIMINP